MTANLAWRSDWKGSWSSSTRSCRVGDGVVSDGDLGKSAKAKSHKASTAETFAPTTFLFRNSARIFIVSTYPSTEILHTSVPSHKISLFVVAPLCACLWWRTIHDEWTPPSKCYILTTTHLWNQETKQTRLRIHQHASCPLGTSSTLVLVRMNTDNEVKDHHASCLGAIIITYLLPRD